MAAVNATITSTNVLTLGFAFGPSRRSAIPPVLWPLLTSPRRAASFRPPPSRTTPRTKRTGHLGHPWRSPQVRPATFTAHPPRLRNGPLMDIGLRHAEPARPDRHASYAQPTATMTARHVFLGSRLRLRLPSHPPRGVAVAIDLWLVPSTSTGDSHPRAASHAGRTRVGRAHCCARPPSAPDVPVSWHPAQASPMARGRAEVPGRCRWRVAGGGSGRV